MKKTLFMLGLMFTALTLSNCTKTEEQDVVPGKPNENAFELFATPTRTTTDGMSTSWAAADEINVFHAVAGTENYVHDTPFTIAAEDLETGRFTGNLAETLDPAKNYDWYLFYPYSSYLTTPANVDGGYTTIGHRDDSAMTQDGNDNMAHVCGMECPLYGIATNIPGSQTPDITMHHLTSVLEVVVTNNAEEEITVSRITFKTANEKIIGRFYIDFSSDNIVYTPHDTFASNQASLNVTNGAPIAVGESAKFYLAIKPFTTSSETLTLTVTTDKGVCEKSIDLTSETSFVAGNIKPLNIGFTVEPGTDPEPLPEGWSIVKNLNQIVDGEYVMVVKTNYGTGYLPTDETSTPTFKTDITIDEENGLITSAVTDNMKWTFSGTASSMTITNINGDALYITNTNKGVKVGTSADFRWTIAAHTSGTNAFSFTSSTVSRFLGVYNNQDWRCYDSIDATNFTDGKGSSKIYLYKSVSNLPALDAPTGLSVSNDVVSWNAVANAGSYTVSVGTISETVSETSYTYTGEAGIFNVSVVANPADAATYRPSAAATLTGVKFGNVSTVTDILTIETLGVTATSYAEGNFSGVSILSNAIYAGNCIKSSPNGAIQLRSKDSNCGIITTTSGGRATKVVVTWNVAAGNDKTATGRTLNIYGSTTPYTSAADLYDTSTQGTLIGTIVCGTSTELVITEDYPYIGLRSDDGSMYLNQIEITWEN